MQVVHNFVRTIINSKSTRNIFFFLLLNVSFAFVEVRVFLLGLGLVVAVPAPLGLIGVLWVDPLRVLVQLAGSHWRWRAHVL